MIAALLAVCLTAGVNVRVALARVASDVSFAEPSLAGDARLDGPAIARAADGRLVVGARDLGPSVRIAAVESGPVAVAIRPGGTARRYRGAIWLHAVRDRITVVNELPLEDYLRGVVPLEMSPSAPAEALRAQAVAARSYALARRGAGNRPLADFDAAGTQAYGGSQAERPATDAAVAATAGVVLEVDGAVLEAVYSACCGGRTAGAEEVWRGPVSGLRSVPCGHALASGIALLANVLPARCGGHRLYRWERLRDLPDLPSERLRIGRLQRLEVRERGASGRVTKLAAIGTAGEAVVLGDGIRALFGTGADLLPSTLFELSIDGQRATIRGGGHGHGVGLCQAGSMAWAREGATARQILGWYYPEAAVTPTAP